MLDNLVTVAVQTGILAALVAAGYACNRAKVFGEEAAKGMIALLMSLVTPCVIIHAFQRPFDPSRLGSLALAFALAFACHALAYAASKLVRTRHANREKTLRFAVVFSNAGFMGLPLDQALFGTDGVFFGAAYVTVFNLVCWTWGLWHMSGAKETLHLKSLLVNPGTLGLGIGIPLFLASYRLPTVIGEPVGMLAALNTPIPMLVIGYYLAEARFRDVLLRPGAWGAAALRLVAVPLVAVGLIVALARLCPGLDRTMLLTTVVAASAPVAALTTAFSVRYGRDVSLSVGLVAGTTVLSMFTMPPVIALAMSLLP